MNSLSIPSAAINNLSAAQTSSAEETDQETSNSSPTGVLQGIPIQQIETTDHDCSTYKGERDLVSVPTAYAVPMSNEAGENQEEQKPWKPLMRGNTVIGDSEFKVASAPPEEGTLEAATKPRERSASEEIESLKNNFLNQQLEEYASQAKTAYEKGTTALQKEGVNSKVTSYYEEAGALFAAARALLKEDKSQSDRVNILRLGAMYQLGLAELYESKIASSKGVQSKEITIRTPSYRLPIILSEYYERGADSAKVLFEQSKHDSKAKEYAELLENHFNSLNNVCTAVKNDSTVINDPEGSRLIQSNNTLYYKIQSLKNSKVKDASCAIS